MKALLSERETKVLTTLSRLNGPSSIKAIADASDLTIEEVMRAMERLKELGYIAKLNS